MFIVPPQDYKSINYSHNILKLMVDIMVDKQTINLFLTKNLFVIHSKVYQTKVFF